MRGCPRSWEYLNTSPPPPPPRSHLASCSGKSERTPHKHKAGIRAAVIKQSALYIWGVNRRERRCNKEKLPPEHIFHSAGFCRSFFTYDAPLSLQGTLSLTPGTRRMIRFCLWVLVTIEVKSGVSLGELVSDRPSSKWWIHVLTGHWFWWRVTGGVGLRKSQQGSTTGAPVA